MLRQLSAEWIDEGVRAEDPAAGAPFHSIEAAPVSEVAVSLRDSLRGMA